MVKNNHKKGFSFAEILVSMLILSLFFLAGAKVFTRKEKDEVMKKVHGFYECYWVGGQLYQALSKFGSRPTPIPVNECHFATVRNNSLFDITILYPNRGGVYYDQQFINTDDAIIIPPRQGNNVAVITVNDNQQMSIPQNDSNVHYTEEMSYEMVKNNLEINSGNANVLTDNVKAGDNNRNGAVIISW